MCFSTRGKRSSFLMSHVDPAEVVASAYRVRDSIEGISGHAIHSFDLGSIEYFNEQFCDVLPRHYLDLLMQNQFSSDSRRVECIELRCVDLNLGGSIGAFPVSSRRPQRG
jgi:hypothetical protein